MKRVNRRRTGPPLGLESRRLPTLLRRAWYGLNQAFRRRIAHLGITPDQYTVLRTLTEHCGLTQRELTQHMASDPNTVASLVRRMEAGGLVERQPHERDRRAQRLRLQPAGRDKYAAARQFALSLQHEVLSALPEADQGRFLSQLFQVSEGCHRATGTAGAEPAKPALS
jgi:DNA-binding MarR family transcriptional regulator